MSEQRANHPETDTRNTDGVNPTTIDMREEDQYVEENIKEQLRLDIGDIIEDNENPILITMAKLANSPDLLKTQRTIISYESGDGPLFRFLGHLLALGETILTSEIETIKAAFNYLREKFVNEAKHAKEEGRKNRGLKNIGVPTIPVPDQRFFRKMKEDSYFIYKTIVNFYFPNLAPATRNQ